MSTAAPDAAERRARVKALFGAAFELPAAEREAYLEREAAGDADVIAEVKSLLAAHDALGDFLESVPANLRVEAFAADADAGREGERIGAYRIVGMLGSGGMGDVYLAVRADDQYRAEVAIKLMRADVRGTPAEQRFKIERQILAQLDHRNIARLLDGGTTATGLPYVVMERVLGKPIDVYCDEKNLGVRERVQLFLQVCAAVSYAHQHLVVHRDLKPNNILVTADGSVKLLDFGIAKLLEADPVTGTAVDPHIEQTMTQMRVMTLDYASPEQVSGGTVTTVSDVYSLGVVLYRLLTGESPYGARLNDAQRVAKILSDDAPTRPSAVRTVTQARQREIDADLDDILLMALRKEPQKRYGSVEQFANDLRGFLTGFPVQARGNALRYRVGKFLRRRKVEVAATAIVVVSLVGGVWVAIREAREADREREVAQRHFTSVRKLANTLLFDIHDQIAEVPGATKARQTLLATSLEYLDTLSKEAGSDRKLQEELGTAYSRMGQILGSDIGANVGDPKKALDSYARAIALLEPIVAANPANQRAGVVLGRTYVEQSRLLITTSGVGPAFEPARMGARLSREMSGGYVDDAERAKQLVAAYWAEAIVLAVSGRMGEAAPLLEKMTDIAEKHRAEHPLDGSAGVTLSNAYTYVALLVADYVPPPDGPRRAIEFHRKAMAVDEQLVAVHPDVAHYEDMLAADRFNLGDVLYARGEYAEALRLIRLASPVYARAAKDRADAKAQLSSATIDIGLAKTLVKVGNYGEAGPIFERTEAALEALTQQGANLRVQLQIANVGVRRGEMYMLLAADPHLTHAVRLDLWRKAQASLTRGVAEARKFDATFKLEGQDREILDDGAAALAKVEAELAGRAAEAARP